MGDRIGAHYDSPNVQEKFQPRCDVTTLCLPLRFIDTFQPDGKDAKLEQIAYGIEFLSNPYWAVEHIPTGIIANSRSHYGRAGDPCDITDRRIYDPRLGPDERRGRLSRPFDEPWLLTTLNTRGQHQFAQVVSVYSRLFRGYNDAYAFADEWLQAAGETWEHQRTHELGDFGSPIGYRYEKFYSWALAATAQLLLTAPLRK